MTNRIEFRDGVYIDGDEVRKFYKKVRGNNQYDLTQKSEKEVNSYLNALKKLSEFYTMRSIKEYLQSNNPNKEKMSLIDYAFYDLSIFGKESEQIIWIIDNYCHEGDQIRETSLDLDYDDRYKKLDKEQIQLSDGYISIQEIYDYFRERHRAKCSATNYINQIRRLVQDKISLEDLRSNRDIPGLRRNLKRDILRELAENLGRNLNSRESTDNELSKVRKQILKLTTQLEETLAELKSILSQVEANQEK